MEWFQTDRRRIEGHGLQLKALLPVDHLSESPVRST
jgi:hypothetical protein